MSPFMSQNTFSMISFDWQSKTVYNCTLFNEINSDMSFHVPEDSQYSSLLFAGHEIFSLQESEFQFHEI